MPKSKTQHGGKKVHEEFVPDTLVIRGQEISTLIGKVNQADLRFYLENPRVYSLVHGNGGSPTQDDIEKQLQEMEHVKELVLDIKNNGGLIEALLVKDGTLEVLEGNSRLAAIRQLARKDPVRWGKVKCILLDKDIGDAAISALLSQLHLKGKREWPPYEQGGHLYRRHTLHSISLANLASETGLKKSVLHNVVQAYELMEQHKDRKRENWSYYLELIKSRKIERARKANSDFDTYVVKKITSGDFRTAQDLRDKLPVICGSPQTLRRFLDGKINVETAYEEADAGGAIIAVQSKFDRFRKWIAQTEVRESIIRADLDIRKAMSFEIAQLRRILDSIEKKISQQPQQRHSTTRKSARNSAKNSTSGRKASPDPRKKRT